MMASSSKKQSARDRITQAIAKAMQEKHLPWRQPWSISANSGHPCNFVSKKRYNGINVLQCMFSALERNFTSKYWGTLNQWGQIGAYVKKKPPEVRYWGTTIILYNLIEDKEKTEKDGKKRMKPLTRFYTVFNVEQVEPPDIDLLSQKPMNELNKVAKKVLGKAFPELVRKQVVARLIHDNVKAKLDSMTVQDTGEANSDPDFGPAEELMAATGAQIKHGGDRAFYKASSDTITLPPKRSFSSLGHYYETAFHELSHWSMQSSRLNIGKEGYAFNELVCEMAACFVAAEVGVPLAEEMLSENQKYLKVWLGRMGNDTKFIFEAAKLASKVTDYLLSFVSGEQSNDEEE